MIDRLKPLKHVADLTRATLLHSSFTPPSVFITNMEHRTIVIRLYDNFLQEISVTWLNSEPTLSYLYLTQI